MRKMNRPTSSSVGPNENSSVSSSERSSAGLAFTVTPSRSRSPDSSSVSANVGTSVSNFFEPLTSFLNSPWTVEPLDEISLTLPFSICSVKTGV